MTERYYVEKSAKATFRLLLELFSLKMPRIIAWPLAAWVRLFILLRFLNIPSHGVGFVGSEIAIDPQELPGKTVARWAPILEQLRDLNFELLTCEMIPTIGMKLQYSTILIDQPGATSAILEWSRMPALEGIVDFASLEFNSCVSGAPDIVTAAVSKKYLPGSDQLQLESVDMRTLDIAQPIEAIYQQHQLRCEGQQIVPLRRENALQSIRQQCRQRQDECLKAGFIRELTAKEISHLRKVDRSAIEAT